MKIQLKIKNFDFYDYEKTFSNLNYNKRILTKLFETSKQRALNRNEVKDKHLLRYMPYRIGKFLVI